MLLKDTAFYESRQSGSVRKRLKEGWQQQNAVVFVVIGAITQGNKDITDYSRRFLIIQSNGKDRLWFLKLYLGNLSFFLTLFDFFVNCGA